MLNLKEVSSTNDYVKEHLGELDNFECVYTLNQTNGKGRTGHTWDSEPNKNIALSLLIKSDKILKNYNTLPIVTGVVVADYLETLGLEEVSLKWPNDVYVNGKKSESFLEEIRYLGHIISKDGIHMDTDKLKIIEEWPQPRNLYKLRSFIGMCSYYRRFIENFSIIARPLHNLKNQKVKF